MAQGNLELTEGKSSTTVIDLPVSWNESDIDTRVESAKDVHKSDVTGVIWRKARQKWIVYFTVMQEGQFLGSFTDKKIAEMTARRFMASPVYTGKRGYQYTRTRGGASKYKNVIWRKDLNKWESKIQRFGKQWYNGWFDNELDAAKASDEKSLEIWGGNAILNSYMFPDDFK